MPRERRVRNPCLTRPLEQDPRKERSRTEALEAVMAGFVTLIALLLAVAASGVIVAVALAVRREDHRYSLTFDAPDRLSRTARRVNGVGLRVPDAELAAPASRLVRS
jgi:hypothetical protein